MIKTQRQWHTVLTAFFAAAMAMLAVTGAYAQETKKLVASKAEMPPKIDGSLDDPCWATTPKGDGFVLRSIGKPPMETTEFQVCYDDTSLYFAFYCHDSQPDQIRAVQKERDADLDSDDFVRIYLDAYHEHRTAEEFIVNPLGTQADERKRGTNDKISWKGDWHTAAKRVDDGWTAEMQIPFSILNYKSGATSMGLNVRRTQQRLGETSDWTYLDDGDQVERYGDLEGLLLPPVPKKRAQIMPYLLRSLTIGSGHTGRMGLDVKQPFGEDNTLMLTAFPDFGTIESAVKSIDFSYTAQRYSDNRPFFQEANSVFSSPYLYTTGIPDFDYGAKVFGKQGKLGYGLMSSVGTGQRIDSVATLGYDLPGLTHAKLMMIGRDDDTIHNKVAYLRLGGQPTPATSWWMSGAKSFTTGESQDGVDYGLGFDYAGPRLSVDGSWGRVSKGFNPANGYVDYPGSTAWDIGIDYGVEQPGKWLREWGGDLSFDNQYDSDHGVIDRETDIGLYADFANHTSWSFSHYWGPHIANYEADPVEEPYMWNSDSGYGASFSFRNNDIYRSGGISYNWGQVGGGPTRTISANCGFVLGERLSTRLSLRRVHRTNPEEGDYTGVLGILSAKYELTPEKSFATRLIHRKEGTNITLSYRQRVRQGLDIFALLGDYNSDSFVNRFSIKLIATE